MRPRPDGRGAWTLLEVIVASGLTVLLIGGAYGWLHLAAGHRASSLTSRTTASSLRQDARTGLEKLVTRLESSVEILSPEPGQVAAELIFHDLLNHEVRFGLDPATAELATFRNENGSWVRESAARDLVTAGGTTFQAPTQPTVIRDCRAVRFHVFSPTLVNIELTLSDSGTEGTVVTMVHLRNSQMLEN